MLEANCVQSLAKEDNLQLYSQLEKEINTTKDILINEMDISLETDQELYSMHDFNSDDPHKDRVDIIFKKDGSQVRFSL